MTDNKLFPKVSIVIPVYNGANFLNNAIDSALGQTYQNIEVLVINDGSSDDGATERIAQSYGEKIRYFSKPNGGVSSALNYGIAQMTGDYFSWLSHDDSYSPTKIADAVDLLRSMHQLYEKTIAFTFGHYIDQDGNVIKPFWYKLETGRRYSGEEMVEFAVRNGTLYGCCMLIPKSAFEELGGLDESLHFSQDTLMWYTLYFGGYGLVSDGKDNVMIRLHSGQVTRNRRDLFVHDSMVIAKKIAPELEKYSNRTHNLLYFYSLRAAQHNCWEVACYYRDFSCRKCPFTVSQKVNLALRMFYGKYRETLKRIYYRYILKVGT